MKSRTALLATVALVSASLLAMCAASPAPKPATSKQLAAIENQARYRQADWGYTALDASSGARLIAQNDVKLFDPGSTMKTYAVDAALDAYGSNYRFRTPVYRAGSVAGGTLTGNLVLVASGDPSLGLRENVVQLHAGARPDRDARQRAGELTGRRQGPHQNRQSRRRNGGRLLTVMIATGNVPISTAWPKKSACMTARNPTIAAR